MSIRDILLQTKVCLVKAMVFLVVMYGCESWTIKKAKSKVARLWPTLCDPMDCSLPGSSVHRIFQAVVLEWVAISYSRGSSQPRDPILPKIEMGPGNNILKYYLVFWPFIPVFLGRYSGFIASGKNDPTGNKRAKFLALRFKALGLGIAP